MVRKDMKLDNHQEYHCHETLVTPSSRSIAVTLYDSIPLPLVTPKFGLGLIRLSRHQPVGQEILVIRPSPGVGQSNRANASKF